MNASCSSSSVTRGLFGFGSGFAFVAILRGAGDAYDALVVVRRLRGEVRGVEKGRDVVCSTVPSASSMSSHSCSSLRVLLRGDLRLSSAIAVF